MDARDIPLGAWVFTGMIFAIILLYTWLVMHPPPPDTRTELQKMTDNCIYNVHANYLSMRAEMTYNCDVLLDVYLGNGWNIISTDHYRNGDIESYMLQHSKP